MAIPSFFKQNKPRGFNYKPRYYDPVKEEMEQRRKAWATESNVREAESGAPGSVHKEQGIDHSSPEAARGTASQPYRSKIMRGDMKNFFNRKQERVQKQTTIRLIVIILIIVLVVYLYLRF
jgi:hypothetical protein